jgi:hypothetical protein
MMKATMQDEMEALSAHGEHVESHLQELQEEIKHMNELIVSVMKELGHKAVSRAEKEMLQHDQDLLLNLLERRHTEVMNAINVNTRIVEEVKGDTVRILQALEALNKPSLEKLYVDHPCVFPKFPRYPSLLGVGSFGKVYLKRCTTDGHLYAVKRVSLLKLQMTAVDISSVTREVETLCLLTHPNIIRYFQSFFSLDEEYFYVVLEYASNGALYEVIPNVSLTTDENISKWMKQAFSAHA